MDKSQQVSRRTCEQMFPFMERYKSSGQLQREFCRSHDINIGTFQYWLKKYREEQSAEEVLSVWTRHGYVEGIPGFVCIRTANDIL